MHTVLDVENLTDGQTDGQTDRIFIARPRPHCVQRGKNHIVLSPMKLPKRLGCLEEHRELLQKMISVLSSAK